MERNRSAILNDTTAVPKRPVIDTIETDLLALLNHNSYEKGAFVLHMLRSQLGDSAFFAGLRGYYAGHKHGTALTADLQSSLERASGKKLGAFFDQWLRRPGYPEASVSWTSDPTAHKTTVSVTQSRRFGYFEFPLSVLLVDRNGGQHSYKILVVAEAVTRFETDYRGADVVRVILDPDVTMLFRDLSQ